MQIIITNCDVNLKSNFGINMQDIGAYDHLCVEVSAKIPYQCLEYDFPPEDRILLDIADGIAIPDLSQFGEVQPYGNPMG